MVSYRTPLSRARGLGAAKHGVGHWISERVSAVALVPLTLWAVWAVARLARGDYDFAVAWVRQPLNATLMVLLLAIPLRAAFGLQGLQQRRVQRRLDQAQRMFACGSERGKALAK